MVNDVIPSEVKEIKRQRAKEVAEEIAKRTREDSKTPSSFKLPN